MPNQPDVKDKLDTAIRKTSDQNTVTAIDRRAQELEEFFAKTEKHIMAAIGQKYSKEQFIASLYSAIRANPEIKECSNHSILGTVLNAGLLGLRLDPTLGQAYIVPFRNRDTSRKEAQLLIGYKGMIALARRSNEIKRIECDVVRENDEFHFKRGSTPELYHSYQIGKDRGNPIAYYALVELTNGALQFEIKSKADVDRVKGRSNSPNSPAWRNNFDEMGMKTAFHSLAKWLPLDTQLAIALDSFSGEKEQDYSDPSLKVTLVEGAQPVLPEQTTERAEVEPSAPPPDTQPEPAVVVPTQQEKTLEKLKEIADPVPIPAAPAEPSKGHKLLEKTVKSCRNRADINRTVEAAKNKLAAGTISQLEYGHILMLLDEREAELAAKEATK